MFTITFILPSGRKVRAKLKRPELQKIVEEAELYHYPIVKRTWKQKAKFFWTHTVKVVWIKGKNKLQKLVGKLHGPLEQQPSNTPHPKQSHTVA